MARKLNQQSAERMRRMDERGYMPSEIAASAGVRTRHVHAILANKMWSVLDYSMAAIEARICEARLSAGFEENERDEQVLTVEHLLSLAQLYDVSPTWLLSGSKLPQDKTRGLKRDRYWNKKLTFEDCQLMRAMFWGLGYTQTTLAEIFHCSLAHTHRIVNGYVRTNS